MMFNAMFLMMLMGDFPPVQPEVRAPVGSEPTIEPERIMTDRCEISGAQLGSRMYLSHGPRTTNLNNAPPYTLLSSLDVYDFKTKVWSSGPSSPLLRFGTQSVALNGRIFLLGGHGAYFSSKRLSQMEAFDPSEGHWQKRAPMMEARHEAMAVPSANQVFVFGGENAMGRILRSVESYEEASGRWRYRTPMPRARKGGSARLFRNLIFLFGGVREDGRLVREVDIYDPKTDQWFVGPTPMPEGRWGADVVSTSTHLVISGGIHRFSPKQFARTILLYDPLSASWSSLPGHSPRHGHAAAFFENNLYVFGGCSPAGETFSSYVERMPLTSLKKSERVRPVAKSPYLPQTSKTADGKCPYFDPQSGLCWQNPGAEHPLSWQNAQVYCDQVKDGGFDDWRVPSIRELRSLVVGCEADICDEYQGPKAGCYWPETIQGECSWYHAADRVQHAPHDAQFLYFQNASAQSGAQAIPKYVRCVR